MIGDTSPEAEAVQLELLRNSTVARRYALLASLTDTTRKLARRAIARANPELDEQEVALLFVEYHYGRELAEKVRQALRGTTK
jgi:hypothetical protein